jgi:hypothetical protein
VAHASCAMASTDSSDTLQDRLLRRLHASCLVAPRAFWYPATPTARADGAAAQHATAGGASLSAGSIDEAGPSSERLQHILRAAGELLGEQHPGQRGERQQPGSVDIEGQSDAFKKQTREVGQLLHSVASAQTDDGQSQQVSSRKVVHHLLLENEVWCSSLTVLSITAFNLSVRHSLSCL